MTKTSPKKAQVSRCSDCGCKEIEICLPAYFLANGTLDQPVSVDCEADALTYWCPDCDSNVAVRAPDGEILEGVWD